LITYCGSASGATPGFVCTAPGGDQEYFADGITEDIIGFGALAVWN
jgi:TolB-like protein